MHSSQFAPTKSLVQVETLPQATLLPISTPTVSNKRTALGIPLQLRIVYISTVWPTSQHPPAPCDRSLFFRNSQACSSVPPCSVRDKMGQDQPRAPPTPAWYPPSSPYWKCARHAGRVSVEDVPGVDKHIRYACSIQPAHAFADWQFIITSRLPCARQL